MQNDTLNYQDLHNKIVAKHGLLPTSTEEHFGQTFVYDVKIYHFRNIIFFAECNTLGEPTEGMWLVYNKNTRPIKYGKMTSEFLYGLPTEEILRLNL